MNDARSFKPQTGEVLLTGGTGVQPEIGTIFKDTNLVEATGNFSIIPVFGFSGKYQLAEKHQLLFGAHLPITFSSVGLRLGYQYNIFSNDNIAFSIGGLAGTAFTKDSLFGSELGKPVNNFWHGDAFCPLTISVNEHLAFSLTPRYSWARFAVRQYYDMRFPIQKLYFQGKIASFGMHYKKYNAEVSYFFDAPIKWQFGLGWRL